MKIAMLFPGYGSQYIGMGKELYDEHRLVQEYFDEASSCLDINFVKLCFASSDADIRKMRNGYTSIFLVSSSIVGLLKERGIEPEVVAGFNHGEYAALFAAGGWSLPDGLYLLNKLAQFYEQELSKIDASAVRVKGLPAATVDQACKQVNAKDGEIVHVAIYERETEQIIAGNTPAVNAAQDILLSYADGKKISIEQEDVAIGLHSSLMDPVAAQLKMYLEKVDFHNLNICLIESLHGQCIELGDRTKERILERMSSPIVWPKVMQGIAPYDVIVQVGPGDQLAQWAKEMYPDKPIFAINTQKDLDTLHSFIEKNR